MRLTPQHLRLTKPTFQKLGLQLEESRGRVVVHGVHAGSIAAEYGFEPGSILESINSEVVISALAASELIANTSELEFQLLQPDTSTRWFRAGEIKGLRLEVERTSGRVCVAAVPSWLTADIECGQAGVAIGDCVVHAGGHLVNSPQQVLDALLRGAEASGWVGLGVVQQCVRRAQNTYAG
mmetsp:Transcript_36256/g.82238  ORF Transcript_36256/g.82238 Transcript_36256/m.82238 type:complete len:181 (-) Transcript_36256:142-684(-)